MYFVLTIYTEVHHTYYEARILPKKSDEGYPTKFEPVECHPDHTYESCIQHQETTDQAIPEYLEIFSEETIRCQVRADGHYQALDFEHVRNVYEPLKCKSLVS